MRLRREQSLDDEARIEHDRLGHEQPWDVECEDSPLERRSSPRDQLPTSDRLHEVDGDLCPDA